MSIPTSDEDIVKLVDQIGSELVPGYVPSDLFPEEQIVLMYRMAHAEQKNETQTMTTDLYKLMTENKEFARVSMLSRRMTKDLSSDDSLKPDEDLESSLIRIMGNADLVDALPRIVLARLELVANLMENWENAGAVTQFLMIDSFVLGYLAGRELPGA